jgi:crotonobetainyl-CoA:carnitine CoA-transferase CaiB-like acyl-CoA transferase
LATGYAGPYAGKLLADLGADVVKAEPPSGDDTRWRGPFPGGLPNPEASGFFAYLNGGKRGIVLDPRTPEGRARILDLAAVADLVIESGAPRDLDARGIGHAALRARNPRIVLLSVTPYGQSGPWANWRANDMTVFHAAGFAYGFPSMQIESADLPPLTAPSHAGDLIAGEVAASAALHGLLAAQATGQGGHIDLSLQEAIATANNSQYNMIDRTGVARREVSTLPSNAVVALLPCSDGWIAISPREEHQWARWLDVMGNPAWSTEERFANLRARQANWAELYPILADWTRQHSKHELFEKCQALRVASYPLGTATDLLQSPQLQDRGFLQRVDQPGFDELTIPGTPYHLNGNGQIAARRAPRLGQHDADVASMIGDGRSSPGEHAPNGVTADRPLAGVRIVDFSWVLTGPICTRILAALGAEVIKVESRARPDLSTRDGSWEDLNPGKLSVTLNLKEQRARELVRELIARSDIVVENFSTGVMERLGLDYAALKEINPRIIMASSSALGRTGPERDRVAYGTLVQCFTGWASLSAHPGRPPRSAANVWTDPLTALLETMLLLAAIYRQRATGEGCFLDISMTEATIASIPEPMLAWAANRETLEARGNRDPVRAPQGAYPTRGDDRWVAISIGSDAEWAALCSTMGRPDLAADPELGSLAGRLAAHDRIDAAIATWTRNRDADEIVVELQSRGIAAAPTLTALDVLDSAHIQARGIVQHIERLNGSSRRSFGIPWVVDGSRPGQFTRPPHLGEHNEYVFRQLLGLDEPTFNALVESQVIH